GGEELGLEGHFTTPEAPEVQAFLARCAASGATHAVLESSSHGFSQHRLDAVAYAVGVVTNVSPEHLDHHGTFAAYVDAKATLVRRAATAVLNRDDAGLDAFAAAAGEAGARVVTYGQSPGVDARLLRVAEPRGALELTLDLLGERVVARLPMVGRYNAWNAAAALATAVLEGVPADAAAAALASFPGVPGRMQVIATTPFTVIVDFAHTPPALAKALAAVRRPGARTLVVVGSAGERDPGKRAPLGEAAVRGADVAVLTEEDSRSEDVSAILAAMARRAEAAGRVRGETFHLQPDRRPGARRRAVGGGAGEGDPGKRAPLGAAAVRGAGVAVHSEEDCRAEDVSAILAAMARGAAAAGGVRGEAFHLEPDRREAIALAYRLARPGDVVVLAGKGHERTLERADETVPWDEAATARELLPPGAA